MPITLATTHDEDDLRSTHPSTSNTQWDLSSYEEDRFPNPLAERDFFPLAQPRTNKPAMPVKKQSSFVAILCDLDVGASAVRNHSPNADITLSQLAEELSEMKAMISNNVRPSVRIATEKTGFSFTVETSQTLTPTGRVYVQVIVTRTA